jgi:hypothetical protein
MFSRGRGEVADPPVPPKVSWRPGASAVPRPTVAFTTGLDLTWQEMQAIAQNLGLDSLTTTFGTYGQVPAHQQGDLVRNTGKARETAGGDAQRMMAILEEIRANQAKG